MLLEDYPWWIRTSLAVGLIASACFSLGGDGLGLWGRSWGLPLAWGIVLLMFGAK